MEWLKSNSKALFVIVLLLGFLGTFKFSTSTFNNFAEKINTQFKKRDSIIEKAVLGDKSNLPQKIKLKQQYIIAKETKKTYFIMAKSFNSFGYAFTMLFVISSIASAALAFLVLKKGWDNTDNFYLKSSFVIFFFSASLFGVLPKVFYNKENTKNNLDKYNYYSQLQIDIYELMQDNKRYIAEENFKKLDSCITSINDRIKANQDLYFDTDISNVPKDIKTFQ